MRPANIPGGHANSSFQSSVRMAVGEKVIKPANGANGLNMLNHKLSKPRGLSCPSCMPIILTPSLSSEV